MELLMIDQDTMEIANMREAITGYAIRSGQVVLIYDFTKLVKALIRMRKVTINEAMELAENIEEVWFGQGTPIIIHNATHDEIQDIFHARSKDGAVN